MPRPRRAGLSRLAAGALAALLLLSALTWPVVRDGLLPFDLPVTLWLRGHAGPGWVGAARILNIGGSLAVVVPVTLLGVALLWRQRTQAAVLLGGMTTALLLQLVLNAAVARPRPTLLPHLVAASGLAYPSGHSTLAAALGTLLSAAAWRTRWRWPVLALAALYAGLMGAARVVLGVHHPSDVLAGWLLGVGVGLLAASAGEGVSG
ncbi:phosphatase PAP2 family protein [Deinococcus aerophilus]|uniref:Phosphatidic acid phosphatase type 2/haloperoxidase domain-containing protein n=1 Tax=Deinococcus aerophilus TaxID=522488 RepID=A0ABQ2H0Z8_9DEIO|nr:phosphatase PAP2 family protein [Deinococcus aerophilus]GGM21577.1 hypothetical protein GCM10010841_31810 [Deinococcus aerophilus]